MLVASLAMTLTFIYCKLLPLCILYEWTCPQLLSRCTPGSLEERRLQHKRSVQVGSLGIRGLCSCGVVVDIKLDNHLRGSVV